MKTTTTLKILRFIFGGIGFFMLAHFAGWQVAVAVWFCLLGENMYHLEQHL